MCNTATTTNVRHAVRLRAGRGRAARSSATRAVYSSTRACSRGQVGRAAAPPVVQPRHDVQSRRPRACSGRTLVPWLLGTITARGVRSARPWADALAPRATASSSASLTFDRRDSKTQLGRHAPAETRKELQDGGGGAGRLVDLTFSIYLTGFGHYATSGSVAC